MTRFWTWLSGASLFRGPGTHALYEVRKAGARQGSSPPVGWGRLLSVHVSMCLHARWSYPQNGDATKLLTLSSLRDLGSQLHFRGRCREERLSAGQLETRTTTRLIAIPQAHNRTGAGSAGSSSPKEQHRGYLWLATAALTKHV